MKLSFEWLNDFVDLSGISPEEVADKLTMGAFEVEEVHRHGPDIQGQVIVGEIVEINPHPNADKIRLTKIKFDDSADLREIVCGAWNIEPGHRIPVALPGAKVINRQDGTALHIKESKIRGVASSGMLCSAPELGINGSGEGILILDKDTRLGTDVKKLLHLEQDSILHVEPRSNRGDALCVLGMAREVAALIGRPLKIQNWLDEFERLQAQADSGGIKVSIEDQNDCPFFSARVIRGVNISQSPAEISRRLEAVGVRPVNNVVDITNYVLHELGQPLHAYDLKMLGGQSLSVRRAKAGEKLTTIDSKERLLNDEVLVIADESEPVGVAGVMGGKSSEIAESSKDLVLEAASFNSARVRRSSRTLGLSSDSSLRFERGVDTASVRQASDRASYLMLKHCGGLLGQLQTAGSDQVPEKTIQLRMSELKRITEIEMAPDAVESLLNPLGFVCRTDSDRRNAGLVNVSIPSFRQRDVSREIDLIEELCRLWGYNKIPPSMPKETLAALPADSLSPRIRYGLAACGLNEVWTSSLTSHDDLTARNNLEADSSTAVAVLNPISADHQVLRQSLLPGLLKVTAYNQGRGQQDVWIFELGRGYFQEANRNDEGKPEHKCTPTKEEQRVAALIGGDSRLSSWLETANSHTNTEAFFVMKGVLENLLSHLGIQREDMSFEPWERTSESGWFHPGKSCRIRAKQSGQKQPRTGNGSGKQNKTPAEKLVTLGWLGELHPAIATAYEVKGRPCAFELTLDALKTSSVRKNMKEIHLTPSVIRDLTADLDGNVKHSAVESCIKGLGKGLLKEIELVSVFCPSENQRSLSYRLTFQSATETLTAEAIDSLMSKIRDELKTKLSASFRL